MKLLIIAILILISIGIYLYVTSSKNKIEHQQAINENFETMSTVVVPGDIYFLAANFVSNTANVYGTGPFGIIGAAGTDLFNAARFRGIASSSSTTQKLVRLQIIPPQPSAYFGGVSNAGVTTTTLLQTGTIRGFIFMHAGQTYTITVTGNADNTKANLWGIGPFMDTSNIGKAATYAGILKVGETGPVTVSYVPRQTSYLGGTKSAVDANNKSYSIVSTVNNAPPVLAIAFNISKPAPVTTTTTLAPTTTTLAPTTTTLAPTTTTLAPTTTPPFLNSPQVTYDTLIYRYDNTNTSGGLDLNKYENDEQILYTYSQSTNTYLQTLRYTDIPDILDQKYVSYDSKFQRYNILYSPDNKIISNSMIRGITYISNSAFSFWIKPNNISQLCPIMGRYMDINIYQDKTSLVIVLYGIKSYEATPNTPAYSEYFSYPERWDGVFELDKWVHIIIGYNGTTLNIYKNGVAVSKSLNAVYDNSLLIGNVFGVSGLFIGGNGPDGALYYDAKYTTNINYIPYFNGNIMEIKEFDNTTLNNTIANQIYKLPVPVTYPNNIYVIDPATTYAGFPIKISSSITTTLPTTTLPTTTLPTTTLPTTTLPTTTLPTTTLPTTTLPTTTLPTTTLPTTTLPTTTLPTTTLPTTTEYLTTTTLPTTTEYLTTTTLPTTTEYLTTTTEYLTTTTLPTTTEYLTTSPSLYTITEPTTDYITTSPSTSLYTTSSTMPGYETYPTYEPTTTTEYITTTTSPSQYTTSSTMPGYETYPTYTTSTTIPMTAPTTSGYDTYPTSTMMSSTSTTAPVMADIPYLTESILPVSSSYNSGQLIPQITNYYASLNTEPTIFFSGYSDRTSGDIVNKLGLL